MSTLYQNYYVLPPEKSGLFSSNIRDALVKFGVGVGIGTAFHAMPRVAFTRVVDEQMLLKKMVNEKISIDNFSGCISIGDNCYVESSQLPAFHSHPSKFTSVQIHDDTPGKIRVGNNVIMQGVAIVAYQLVEIGDRVTFGPMVTVMDSSGHSLSGRNKHGEAMRIKSSPVYIGSDSWIGYGATILRGVTIGEGAVIGAQAVVYSDVPPHTVAIGNPARVIKHISQL
ncbi:acyltransferase [Aeromonas sp. 600724]|uniref:acyltransferase n=1 Tax=Aeromonas sp. 600724 TaxID=2712031 RepID=UPI003BA06067